MEVHCMTCRIILKCSLKGTSHNKKEWKDTYIRVLKPATLYVDQSERTFIVSGSEIWTVIIFRRVHQMEDSGIYVHGALKSIL